MLLFALAVYFLTKKKNESKQVTANRIKNSDWFKFVASTANDYNVNPKRIASIIAVESAGDSNALGAVGEIGLMQIRSLAHQEVQDQWAKSGLLGLPGLGYVHKDSELFDPQYNIRVGVTYLAILKQRTGGDLDKATKLYNGTNDFLTSIYLDNVKSFEPYF